MEHINKNSFNPSSKLSCVSPHINDEFEPECETKEFEFVSVNEMTFPSNQESEFFEETSCEGNFVEEEKSPEVPFADTHGIVVKEEIDLDVSPELSAWAVESGKGFSSLLKQENNNLEGEKCCEEGMEHAFAMSNRLKTERACNTGMWLNVKPRPHESPHPRPHESPNPRPHESPHPRPPIPPRQLPPSGLLLLTAPTPTSQLPPPSVCKYRIKKKQANRAQYNAERMKIYRQKKKRENPAQSNSERMKIYRQKKKRENPAQSNSERMKIYRQKKKLEKLSLKRSSHENDSLRFVPRNI